MISGVGNPIKQWSVGVWCINDITITNTERNTLSALSLSYHFYDSKEIITSKFFIKAVVYRVLKAQIVFNYLILYLSSLVDITTEE